MRPVQIFAAALGGLALFGFTAAAEAQMTVDVDRQKTEMAKLEGLVGAWEGSGWIAMGPGEPETFTQSESVSFKADGVLLLIEGEGRGDDGALEHDALGVVSFDEASGDYAFRAYANGRAGTFPMVWLDNGDLRWTMNAGGMLIRYTITLDGETWSEVGEMQTPEGAFHQFYESKLTRVAAAD